MLELRNKRNCQKVKISTETQEMNRDQFGSAFMLIIACLILLLVVSCDVQFRDKEDQVKTPQAEVMDPKNIETMAWQDDDSLWVGNRNGARRLNRIGKTETFNGISCASITITHDRKRVWCKGLDSAYNYDGSSWHQSKVDAYQIAEAGDDTLWAGTRQGLSRFDLGEQKWLPVLNAPEIASHFSFSGGPGIHLSFIADDGAFWFYSFSEPYVGTTRWTGTSSETWQPTGKWTVVQPKLEAHNGTVWGIGDESIIAQWNGQTWRVWQPFSLRPTIGDLIEARDGNIWVMAIADGIGRWDGQTWQIWSRDGAILRNCPGLAEGKECDSPDLNARYYTAAGLGKSNSNQARLNLTALLETQDGTIWVGTAQEGISRWDGSKWHNYTMADGLSSEAITVLTESPDGKLWAGTWGGGIDYFDANTDRWHPFP